jgi:hypothetical protein
VETIPLLWLGYIQVASRPSPRVTGAQDPLDAASPIVLGIPNPQFVIGARINRRIGVDFSGEAATKLKPRTACLQGRYVSSGKSRIRFSPLRAAEGRPALVDDQLTPRRRLRATQAGPLAHGLLSRYAGRHRTGNLILEERARWMSSLAARWCAESCAVHPSSELASRLHQAQPKRCRSTPASQTPQRG